MTLARLLLGGSKTFAPPAPSAISPYYLNGVADGGPFNPWVMRQAYSHGGKTFFSWIDNGPSLRVGTFNETTHAVNRYDLAAGFSIPADAHVTASLQRRSSDGRIIAIYAKHNNPSIFTKLSTNPDDVSAWGSATDLDSQLGGTRYTDHQLYEYGGKLYLFYRDEPSAGTDSRWCISVNPSTSSPSSGWPTQTIVYRVSGTRSYVISYLDTVNGRIHFIATNGGSTVGGLAGFSRLGHFYLDLVSGTYHKSDGTTITLPLSFSSITTIYTGTNTVFAANVACDASGNPVVAAGDKISGALQYIYIRFNGTSWSSTNYAPVGTGYEYSGAGTGFGNWGSCIDDGDVNTVYAIRDPLGDSLPDVYQYVTADGGSTFAETRMTTDARWQANPIAVRSRSSALRILWQYGTWSTYTSYSQGIRGLGS